MRIFFACIITFLLVTSAIAEDSKTLALLKRNLGETIEVHGDNEIWYCPDNTCKLYRVSVAHLDFPSFIYLHLYHESGYIYLDEIIGGEKAFRKVAVEEPKIREAVAHYCKGSEKTPQCIIMGMRKELGVLVGFGRFDEGYFCYGYQENDNICKKL